MKHLSIFFAAAMIFVPTQAMAESMFVERVRYCNNSSVQNQCPNSTINPKFSDWDKYGVEKQEQKETYISIINQPQRSQVKRVVFISAGQQIDKGFPNALTGQPHKYKGDCTNAVKNCTRPINPDSLVARLRASGEFKDSETLYISVLDAKFGYFRDLDQLQKRENAYWDFLTSKFDPDKVELIVLAGQSRAGCLVFRLGSRMRQHDAYKNIPLVVQGYDAVCKTPSNPVDGLEFPQGVFETNTGVQVNNPLFVAYPNPLDSDKKSYIIDMDKVFPEDRRENLKVLNIHGGGKVAFQSDIRSFTWKGQDVDLGWWKQKWVNYEHNDMGGYLENGNVDPYQARVAMGDVGYGHIYNYSKYDLVIPPQPTNFHAKQRFPVDVNGDKKSDIILSWQDPVQGLRVRSKISNGDGTFRHVEQKMGDGPCNKKNMPLMSGYFNDDLFTDILIPCHHKTQGLLLRVKMSNGDGTYVEESYQAGDGVNVLDMTPFVGDVNKDGLSDVILRYQANDGLHIRTKFSNGDGSFNEHDFRAGDGDLGEYQRAHVGDVNGDKRTDLIYLFRRSADGKMEIRTRTSNGDGTYTIKYHPHISGINWNNIQTFVADVNRDKRSDLIVLVRDNNFKLTARTFIMQNDGSFKAETTDFPDGREVDSLETVIADINGDLRSDIVMRVRDKNQGLIIRVKQSNGDGTYTAKEFVAGDHGHVDGMRILTGNYDESRLADLALRFRHSTNGLYIRTKLGTSAGSFTEREHRAGDGTGVDVKEALSGAVHWSGGATFPRPPKNCPVTGCTVTGPLADKAVVKDLGSGTLVRPNSETLKGRPAIVPNVKKPLELKPRQESPASSKKPQGAK